MGYVVAGAGCKQGDKAVVGAVQVVTEAILPVEQNLHGFRGRDIVEIQNGNRAGEEFRMIREGNDGIEAGIVGRPFDKIRVDTAFGEDLLFGTVGEVMKNGDGRDFLVESVVEAAVVRGDDEF